MYEDCLVKAFTKLIEEKRYSESEVADRILSTDIEFISNYLSERDPGFYVGLRKYRHDKLLELAEVECDE